jgi:hypothetical protein
VSVPSPTPPALDDDLGTGSGRLGALLADRRVWIGGGVAAAALILGLLFTGGDEPNPAAAAAEPTPEAAAEPEPEPPAEPDTEPESATATDSDSDSEPEAAPEAAAEPEAGSDSEPGPPGKSVRRAARGPSVSPVAGKLRVKGRLPGKVVLKGLAAREAQLERCYAAALKRKPRMHGRLVYGFTVKRNGQTAAVRKLRGSISDQPLARCVGRVLADLRYPRPKGGTARVTVPLAFEKR